MQTSNDFDSHDHATLLSLPHKMRDEVYASLLSGHLSTFLSSRQLSVEALELICIKAIFRVFVISRQAYHNNHPECQWDH